MKLPHRQLAVWAFWFGVGMAMAYLINWSVSTKMSLILLRLTYHAQRSSAFRKEFSQNTVLTGFNLFSQNLSLNICLASKILFSPRLRVCTIRKPPISSWRLWRTASRNCSGRTVCQVTESTTWCVWYSIWLCSSRRLNCLISKGISGSCFLKLG